ncbi:MAG: acyl-ACP thioesterase domain-containing protein [Acidobacteriota bacterium]
MTPDRDRGGAGDGPRGEYRELFRVRSYEIDPGGVLTLPSLCDYLQEAAGRHAGELGVSVEQLLEQGLTWFLSKLHVRIGSWPRLGETLEVRTWPAELGRPFAIRDFRLLSDGVEVGVASSSWLLMDTAALRPVRRPPDWLRRLHPDPPRRALADTFRRLPSLGGGGSDVDPAGGPGLSIRRDDLDLNGHVNNSAYVRLLVEGLPESTWTLRRMSELEIEYRAEAHLGDRVESRCLEGGDGALLHSLVRVADGRELVRARSRWGPAPAEVP